MIIKGRLDNLHTLPEEMKHPIILFKGSIINDKIILQNNQRVALAGTELTLRQIRLYYWKHEG